jgi:hypothetical protein
VLTPPVAAQWSLPSGVRRSSAFPTAPVGPQTAAAETSRIPARLGLGLVGSIAGLFGGALVGGAVGPLKDCACEDPGLEEMLTGAVVGAALGGALLAAVPKGPDICRYPTRLWRAALGSALGTGLGLIAKGNASLVTVPLGASVGAALGAESCTWQRHN